MKPRITKRKTDADRKFPRAKCWKCEGIGGWQTRPRRYDSPSEGCECSECNGTGYLFSPICHLVRRYVMRQERKAA